MSGLRRRACGRPGWLWRGREATLIGAFVRAGPGGLQSSPPYGVRDAATERAQFVPRFDRCDTEFDS
jgi:hypothetical protein